VEGDSLQRISGIEYTWIIRMREVGGSELEESVIQFGKNCEMCLPG
jgi:hypothetical protein